jgi:replicative DNA helicase
MKKEYLQLNDLPFPESTEIERQVLTDASNNYETLQDIIPVVNRDMFTDKDRVKIWDTIVDLFNNGQQVTPLAVMQRCINEYRVEVAMRSYEPSTPSVMMENAILLRNVAKRRVAYSSALQFIREAVDLRAGELELYSSLESMSAEIQGDDSPTGSRKLAQVLTEVEDHIKERAEAKDAGRVTSGFQLLDEILYGGFEAGNLVILAARPGIGKTATMLQMAVGAARSGKAAQVFSMEMICEDLANRIIFSTNQVEPREVFTGRVENPDAFRSVVRDLSTLPLWINDYSSTLSDIVSQITINNKKGRCDIAFIDYLGRFQDALDNKVPLYQAIGKITGRLKSLAKRLRIPIVLLCQLNRESAKEDRAPQLYDLRDSGSIEQDADIALMLQSVPYAVDKFEGDNKINSEERNRLIMWLRKHRQGWKNDGLVLEPNNSYSHFTEISITREEN